MFHRLNLGDRKSKIAVCIERYHKQMSFLLIQCRFILLILLRCAWRAVIASSGMINDATGTATPLAGF